jgi:hypothetical protein
VEVTAMDELDDIWEFLPAEEEPEPAVELSAEEAAVHMSAPAEWGRTFDDAARRDVATEEEDWTSFIVADDEDDGVVHRDNEHEVDVEELLERQHYSFAPFSEEPPW